MVRSCASVNCTNRYKRNSGITFHLFPKNKKIIKEWVRAMKRDKYVPSKSASLCSIHFQPTDFMQNVKNKHLQPNAVPSIFNFPPSLTKKPVAERKTRGRILKKPDAADEIKTEGHTEISKTDVLNGFNAELADNINSEPQASCSGNFNLEQPTSNMKRKRQHYFGDFSEKDLQSPETRKKFWATSQRTIRKQTKDIKYLRNQNQRVRKQITTIKTLVHHLQENKHISADCSKILQDLVPVAEKQLLLKQLKYSTEKKHPPELRSFALTLHFYSASAYNYVRKTFGNVLPHPSTLRKWYSTVEGLPGFTSESIRAVTVKVEELKKERKTLICGLMMDEMSIRENIQWNGHRHQGYVNFGTGTDHHDGLPKAREALVFMLVALNARWKISIAYFFVNGLSAEDKSNLIINCLRKIHTTGVIVKSLTFDGAPSNIAAVNKLGANLTWPNLKTWFPHSETKQNVYVMLDACHMIKLCRNTLGDWGTIFNAQSVAIKWDFFKQLVNLQNTTGLHAATKLRNRHLNYAKEKMKVKLATQTFSSSVADALEYCVKDLHLEQFQNSDATIEFCNIFNKVFDVLNTRNMLGKTAYKRPFDKKNQFFIKEFIGMGIDYISHLGQFK